MSLIIYDETGHRPDLLPAPFKYLQSRNVYDKSYTWTNAETHTFPGVYALRHKKIKKFYVGSAANIHRRMLEHHTTLKKGRGWGGLQRAFNTYSKVGWHVEVLEETPDALSASVREAKLLNSISKRLLFNKVFPVEVILTPDLIRRYNANFIVDDGSGCWLWKSSFNVDGYGMIDSKRQSLFAHRVGYQIANNDLEPGALVGHKCNIKRCVNPAHLYKASYSDNAVDIVVSDGRIGVESPLFGLRGGVS